LIFSKVTSLSWLFVIISLSYPFVTPQSTVLLSAVYLFGGCVSFLAV
jgi:hypothetical protein